MYNAHVDDDTTYLTPSLLATTDPSRRLWTEVLQQAFIDVEFFSRHMKNPSIRQEMIRLVHWVADDVDDGPTTFVGLCCILDLDPRTVRTAFERQRRRYDTTNFPLAIAV